MSLGALSWARFFEDPSELQRVGGLVGRHLSHWKGRLLTTPPCLHCPACLALWLLSPSGAARPLFFCDRAGPRLPSRTPPPSHRVPFGRREAISPLPGRIFRRPQRFPSAARLAARPDPLLLWGQGSGELQNHEADEGGVRPSSGRARSGQELGLSRGTTPAPSHQAAPVPPILSSQPEL